MLLMMFAASQLSAPIPTNAQDWATYQDVPVSALPIDTLYVVGFRVTVDPSGKPQTCRVELKSDFAWLDSLTCSLVRNRARFTPARDAGGSPVYGVYQSSMTWWVGSKQGQLPPRPFAGDLAFVVNDLPAGTKSPANVAIMFAVDAQGQASSCTAEKREAEAEAPTELVQLACDRGLQQLEIVPAKNGAGVPVPSVQDASVQFSTN